jgi:hypothetical protein
MSSKNEAKAERERKQFKLFAQAMNWPTDKGLIQSRPPKPDSEPDSSSEPDILYQSPTGKVAFELVENCSQSLAHNTAKMLNGNGKNYLRESDPSRAVVKDKLEKKYTSPHPIELLVYTDKMILTPDEVAIDTIHALLDSFDGVPFRRVWYFGSDCGGKLLWDRST